MWPRSDGLRTLELGTPGELRTRLTNLVLAGQKTATAGLLALDYEAEGEEVEHVGEHLILLNDAGDRAAELEIARVDLVLFANVPWDFAQAEGEGYTSIENWREVHRDYWSSQGFDIDDTTIIVCLRFHLIDTP
ncbi:ASCH domain protein [Nonomuraea coxensis DSM 45129]|uniref:ASCH domain protein n=1 Tax=Nonomuraea coxensis DSM 45129 TaxID=1122611 RepID=A0ABX8TW99_9ACTN|nr:ASCH domain-containing protein [Nonomuraea coxensis]QYC39634.1 ASCH domain protein [Nonomuraea coxensis DSM 45129]